MWQHRHAAALSHERRRGLAGAQITCFTSTKVQILTALWQFAMPGIAEAATASVAGPLCADGLLQTEKEFFGKS
jgi:hypothetical protein